ncbi:MAG: ribosomal-processing cysteine protease Prp [Clostridia bacterium]|nr:ribosomal-processing cysteine protease Prp [Clostridia bacterium]
MIAVYVEKRGKRCRLYVEGHAEYAPDGADIVCAGVSALVGSLLLYAKECGNCRHLRTDSAPGRFFLSCRGGLGAAFDLTARGLAAIANSYPRNVRLYTAENA